MRYTVVWLKAAQDHLADIWREASDRQAVAAASNLVDMILGRDPYAHSESRTDANRIMFVPPLAVAYDVSDDDRLVTVWAVWRGQRGGPHQGSSA